MKKSLLIPIIFFVIVVLLASGFKYVPKYGGSSKVVAASDGTNIAFNEIKTGHNEVLIIAPGWFMCKDSKPFYEMATDFSKEFNALLKNL